MLHKTKTDEFATYTLAIRENETGTPAQYVSDLMVQIAEWKVGDRLSYHFSHDTLVYLYSGNITIAVDGEELHAKAGDTVILRGGKAWHYFLDEHNLCRIMSVNFHGALTDTMLQTYGLEKTAHYPDSGCKPLVDMLEAAFRRESNDFVQLENETLRFLLYTFQHLSQSNRKSAVPMAEQAKVYIMRNLYSPELQVQSVAKKMSCNPQKLQGYFQVAYGISMRQFIIRKRLDRVVELLVSSPLSLVEIASLVGYANRNYLDRLFLQYYGMTASAYRKANRSKKPPHHGKGNE